MSSDRFVRDGDPITSLAAAAKASKASVRAIEVLRGVAIDGVPRIDEEMWQACRATGYLKSFDVIRHARLALAEMQALEETGVTRETSSGVPAREWQFVPTMGARVDAVVAKMKSMPSQKARRYQPGDWVPFGKAFHKMRAAGAVATGVEVENVLGERFLIGDTNAAGQCADGRALDGDTVIRYRVIVCDGEGTKTP